MKFKEMKAEQISFSLPFKVGSVTLVPNKAEKQAAWSLYVELKTRIVSQSFNPESGSMRAVLDSLYALFGLTCQVLREAGPDVAHGPDSFGPLAIDMLTLVIAKFATKWHEPLRAYELAREDNVSIIEHERAWEKFEEMHRDLISLQEDMKVYIDALAKIAGVD